MSTDQSETLYLSSSDDVGFVDLLIVLAKHKKVILSLTLSVAVLSVAVSFVLPTKYQATTKLLPPQQSQSSAAAMLSQLGGIAGMAAGASGLKNPNDMYLGMLRSRTIADRLIVQFSLKTVYGTDSQEAARKKLADNTSISSGKDSLITIDVEDSDRTRVASLTNAYVSELARLNKTLAVTEAAQRRVFYEHQLEATKDNLAKAEAALKNRLDTSGVVSVDSESKAILETVGRLKAQVSAKEIELSSMRAFITETNPQYLRSEEELRSLRAELLQLENGRGAEGVTNVGSGGLESIKLLRDLKYNQMLYELLAKQYEAARIDEAKDPSIIQVLDVAVEPERPVKPHRILLIVLSTLVASVVGIFLAFAAEAKQRSLNAPQGEVKWASLRRYLSIRNS